MTENFDRIRFESSVERSEDQSKSWGVPKSVDEKHVDTVLEDEIPSVEDRDYKRKQV